MVTAPEALHSRSKSIFILCLHNFTGFPAVNIRAYDTETAYPHRIGIFGFGTLRRQPYNIANDLLYLSLYSSSDGSLGYCNHIYLILLTINLVSSTSYEHNYETRIKQAYANI